MNGHVGSNVGYDGTHGSFGYGDRNAETKPPGMQANIFGACPKPG